jgi:hypothetical protein
MTRQEQRSKSSFKRGPFIEGNPTPDTFMLEWLLARVAFERGLDAAEQLENVLVHCFDRDDVIVDSETDLPTLLELVERNVGLDARTKVAEIAGPILALTGSTDGSRVEGHRRGRSRDSHDPCSAAAQGKESPMRADVTNDDFRKLVVAERAFREQLPQLLHTHAGRWVAYHGTNVIEIDETKAGAYRACRERGLRTGEVLVRCIEPITEELVFGLG